MISILGCGWFGLSLGKALIENGFKVQGSTTSPMRMDELRHAGITPYMIDLSPQNTVISEEFFNCNVLIIAIPPKLRNGDRSEYLLKIETIIQHILKYKITKVIYISSTGVYPEVNNDVDELTMIEPQTSSNETLLLAERLLSNDAAFKTTVVRFGGLIGPGRHPGKFFAGKQAIPNGQAPVNLIHLEDCIGITKAILKQDAFGRTFNACAPDHPQKQLFYTRSAEHAGLPLPYFIDELKEWKKVQSVNLSKIINYQFRFADWDSCFKTAGSF